MNDERAGQTPSILTDGKVLFTNGAGSGYPNGAELYDPLTESWAITDRMNDEQ